MSLSRRRFCTQACTQAGSLLLLARARGLPLQEGPAGAGPAGAGPAGARPTARPNVAAIDRERILAAARRAAALPPQTIAAFPAPHGPGGPQDFYSTSTASVAKTSGTGRDAEKEAPRAAAADSAGATDAAGSTGGEDRSQEPFLEHREALLRMTLAVPALAAAYVLLRATEREAAEGYARAAMGHLRAWFVDPETRMAASLEFGARVSGSSKPQFEAVLETAALAEVAIAVAALATSQAAQATSGAAQATSQAAQGTGGASGGSADLAAVRGWFGEYLEWLMTSRQAVLARDQKDHHGSSWLLQTAAYALLTGKDAAVAELRHRYKTVTLRAQIVADGVFPHELTTADPYRNSLFNLDMMAAATDLLSTRFETLWEFQLQDGPGMRVVAARFFPFIERRSAWPYKADATRFSELPCRRPGLLFAARAYDRPEYAEVWRGLPAEPTDPVILATFPIRQPLLWVVRPRV